MELRLRKRINNRLPRYATGLDSYGVPLLGDLIKTKQFTDPLNAALNTGKNITNAEAFRQEAGVGGSLNPWIAAIQMAGSGIAEAINQNPSVAQIRDEAGMSVGTAQGVDYQRYNDINQKDLLHQYNKQMGLSFLTNPFKGLTMLFGRRKYKRNLRKAALENANYNNYAMSSAVTDSLQAQYANEYGNPQDQILYAKKGVEALDKKGLPATGMMNGNEVKIDEGDDTHEWSAYIPKKKTNKDEIPVNVTDRTNIYVEDYGLADLVRPVAKAIESVRKDNKNLGTFHEHTKKFQLEQAGKMAVDVKNKQREYKDIGLLPDNERDMRKFDGGRERWERFLNRPALAYGPTILSSIGGLIGTALQKQKYYNYEVPLKGERRIRNGMYSLDINPYPIIKGVQDQGAINAYNIRNTGNLSSSQKANALTQSGISMYRSIADALAKFQYDRNALKQHAFTTDMNLADLNSKLDMFNKQNSNQMNSLAHASKLGLFNTFSTDLANYSQALWKAKNQKDMFALMYPLYAQQAMSGLV